MAQNVVYFILSLLRVFQIYIIIIIIIIIIGINKQPLRSFRIYLN